MILECVWTKMTISLTIGCLKCIGPCIWTHGKHKPNTNNRWIKLKKRNITLKKLPNYDGSDKEKEIIEENYKNHKNNK